MDKKHLEAILESARMAPSADNSQPWIFQIKEEKIHIFHDLKRTYVTDLYNIDYFADYVGLGCLLENVSITAQYLGYEVIIRNDFSQNCFCAILEFEKKHFQNCHSQYTSIFKRSTNRKAYKKKPVPFKVSENLKKIAEKKGVQLHWINDRKKIKKLSRLIAKHDILLWENEMMRDNLLRMLRFGKKKNYDGLHLDSLELGIKKYFFLLLIHLGQKYDFFWKFLSIGSTSHTQKNILHSGAIGLITTSEKHSGESYIKGGQAMQSIWINLTSKNINFQPIFGPIALIINQKMGKENLAKRHKKIRDKITDSFQKIFPELKNSTPVALFRAGYGKKPSVISPRRKMEEILKID